MATAGGTYAKAMPNMAPFGPGFPGQKGSGHNPDEWMTVGDLVKIGKIYALALYQMGNL
ncbi:MAG: M20 family metallopeptidase [Hungatella sp.]|nr:M20 family metallopeptidase [Hungatella sp.]